MVVVIVPVSGQSYLIFQRLILSKEPFNPPVAVSTLNIYTHFLLLIGPTHSHRQIPARDARRPDIANDLAPQRGLRQRARPPVLLHGRHDLWLKHQVRDIGSSFPRIGGRGVFVGWTRGQRVCLHDWIGLSLLVYFHPFDAVSVQLTM